MSTLKAERKLVIQSIIYVAIIATGLSTAIASLLSKNSTNDTCILYGKVSCENYSVSTIRPATETTRITTTSNISIFSTSAIYKSLTTTAKSIHFHTVDMQPSVCTFVSSSNFLACVLFGFVLAIYHAYSAHRSRTHLYVVENMPIKVLLFVSILCGLLTMSTACSITSGLSNWCYSLEAAAKSCNHPFNYCAESQELTWSWSDRHDSIIDKHFQNFYFIAETANWVNVGFWLIQITIYIYILCHHKKASRITREPFATDIWDAFN